MKGPRHDGHTFSRFGLGDGFRWNHDRKSIRQHYGFPIQYVSARTGIDVDRLRYIEGGSDASDDEIIAIGKAFEVPHEMFR
jgi:hypothetical protein